MTRIIMRGCISAFGESTRPATRKNASVNRASCAAAVCRRAMYALPRRTLRVRFPVTPGKPRSAPASHEPVAALRVHYENLPVKIEKHIEGWIARLRHGR